MWNTKHKNIFGFKNYMTKNKKKKQKTHIMLNEQCKYNAWQCLTKLQRVQNKKYKFLN